MQDKYAKTVNPALLTAGRKPAKRGEKSGPASWPPAASGRKCRRGRESAPENRALRQLSRLSFNRASTPSTILRVSRDRPETTSGIS
jgi:hypothetical protein